MNGPDIQERQNCPQETHEELYKYVPAAQIHSPALKVKLVWQIEHAEGPVEHEAQYVPQFTHELP